MSVKSILLFLLSLIATVAAANPAQKLQPCEIKDVPAPSFCGSLEVPENRSQPDGRKIPLHIVSLQATTENKQPDPIFILQGGPGQAATGLADFYADVFTEARKQRDIVLVDQRGTGKSNPLKCDLIAQEKGLQGYLDDLLPVDRIRACREELEKRADLTMYTTEIGMEDIDQVRQWLGYEKINIYGTSYGTWAAIVYVRKFPQNVRSMILKGLAPPTMRLSVTTAKDMQRALDTTIDDCLNDSACRAAFPKLREEYESIMSRLDKGPIQVKVDDPQTGKPVDLVVSKQAFAITLRALLHSPASASQVPLLLHAAAHNNFQPFLKISIALRQGLNNEINIGMFLTVYCSEEIPLINEKMISEWTKGTAHGDTWVNQIQNACAVWPSGKINADFYRISRSELPVLLISGGLDPVTPPRWGEETKKFFPNSLHVVVKNASHSFNQMKGCVDVLMNQFIEVGSVEGLDPSCADRIQRPPFATK